MKSIPFARSLVPLVAAAGLLLAAPAIAESVPNAGAADPVLSGTLAKMTWPEVQQAAHDGAIVLLPIAVVEQHGPHMDLTPDIYETAYVCRTIKARLETLGTKVVVAPPFYWGIADARFPGSFTVKPETMKAVLADTVDCLKNWGFKTVFFINGHGDPTHRRTVSDAADEIAKASGLAVFDLAGLAPKGFTPPPQPRRPVGAYSPEYHAGAVETAMMLSLYPAAVRPKMAKTLKPQSTFEPLGYAGNPAGYEAEDGPAFLEQWAETETRRLQAFLKEQTTPSAATASK